MQRSKQQAVMFLLGAVLVGGVLGVSGTRMYQHQKFAEQYGMDRREFYSSLGLSTEQKARLDSLAFAHQCAVDTVLAPARPKLDSIRRSFRAAEREIYNSDQRAKIDQRVADMKKKREAEQAQEPRKSCSGK
jgi:hypothetical protein